MRKLLGLLLVLALVFATGTSAFAGEKGGKGHIKNEKAAKTAVEQTDLQKAFKQELNQQKKEVAKAKGALEEQKEALTTQYDALVAAGDQAGADALLAEIALLDGEIATLQAQMKQIINERYMIIKTEYTDEELAQFENAAALIEQMYADAEALGAGTIIVRDNIIKIEAPAYIKGGRTIIPVRAITEELGAAVNYDQATQTVHVTKDGIDIVFAIGSTKVFVNGVEQQLDATAEITCGRTYVPLRFIAETFGLAVTFDEETGTIDIDDETAADAEDPVDEGIVDDGSTDGASDDSTTDGTPDDGTTDDGATGDGTGETEPAAL